MSASLRLRRSEQGSPAADVRNAGARGYGEEEGGARDEQPERQYDEVLRCIRSVFVGGLFIVLARL